VRALGVAVALQYILNATCEWSWVPVMGRIYQHLIGTVAMPAVAITAAEPWLSQSVAARPANIATVTADILRAVNFKRRKCHGLSSTKEVGDRQHERAAAGVPGQLPPAARASTWLSRHRNHYTISLTALYICISNIKDMSWVDIVTVWCSSRRYSL
jgi:hypothetical protein